ncbi:LysR family transcriptional regulator [Pectobacterium atrosepticum]|uniref:LysR family transcriptional regulator n=1 Tax=Pectobacterium atrosepticum TaxID=29471 RepID=UPI00049ADAE8|nr:LysR family transcriptional regulator [Pectobacterium atrosepticum]GKV86692.1 LysR family transcriptional regulator [Pectobacterium carotovorum subsp. carotovorum]AIA72344.1 LysR family transcriptional regulator [Pectobacterium atrosepticum]AIK15322.1 LysR-family transcriptional regulator [Pectobacterium atrosepticum]ATY92083.1 LysR family transcriptional regulator [Pectobacterium atrosepticum]KFX14641.1 LysR family transcriptional regulator [Pectobacterium atrosepticum]
MENDFRGVDLNLLVTFLVLYREKSVSAAADKLHLGQPAVSGALARLRTLFDDPLFIRTGQVMRPTARADYLATQLSPTFEQLQSVLGDPERFDPRTDSRVITLGMTDWVEIWLMPLLLKRLNATAPNLRINLVATDPFLDVDRLENDSVDLVISVASSQANWLKQRALLSSGFRVLWHPQQLTLPYPLPLALYSQQRHLLVTYRERARGVVDDMLEKQEMTRTIHYTTPHFSALLGILQQTPSVATVPEKLATLWCQHYGLVDSPVPLDLPRYTLSALWHARQDSNPAIKWLYEQIAEVVEEQEANSPPA